MRLCLIADFGSPAIWSLEVHTHAQTMHDTINIIIIMWVHLYCTRTAEQCSVGAWSLLISHDQVQGWAQVQKGNASCVRCCTNNDVIWLTTEPMCMSRLRAA